MKILPPMFQVKRRIRNRPGAPPYDRPPAVAQYSRPGQVFALDGVQNTEARQSTTKVGDCCTTTTGEVASNAVALPL